MAKLSIVVFAAFFLACAYADSPLLGFTFVDLIPGATPTTGTILPVLSSEAAEYPQNYYRLWVPSNVQTLELTLSQTDSVCTGDIRYGIHGDHVPCGQKWSEGTDDNFPCRYAITDYFTDSSPDTVTLYPGFETNSGLITPGNWVYISLSRDVSGDFAETCTYTILTTLTTCPNANEYALNEGSSTSTCKVHSDITLPYVTNWNTQLTEAYFRVWIPERTAHMIVYVNNTDYSTTFYGNPKYPGGSYYSECYDYAYNYNSYYELTAACFNPPAGWYYFYFYTSSTGYFLNGNVSIMAKTCPENQAGYNCSYQAWNLTGMPALAGAQYGVEAGEGGNSQLSGFSDGFKIWYISSANGTLAVYNFTVTLTVGTSSWVYYRRGGFISDNSDNYLFFEGLTIANAETITLTPSDFWVGGAHYFGVSNEGTATVNFTLSSAAGSVSTSTGLTGAATDSATTGSGASTIFASFALIAALIAALF